MAQDQQDAGKLLPWPWRVLVFAALAAVAVLAIRIMDGHAMQSSPAAHRAPVTGATAPRGQ